MSNFPTAFWKKQPESIAVAQGISITWETGLFWSRGGNVGEGDINSPETPSSPVPPLLQSSFPFIVSVESTALEYYSSYDDTIWEGNDGGNLPYYGWYLTGGYDQGGQNKNDLSSYHRGEPWISHSSGIALWSEADHYTASLIDENLTRATYNAFVQSGSATGTFSVSAAQAAKGGTGVSLYTTVSGLGEDFSAGPAPHYNEARFYLNSTKIGEAVAPQDGVNPLGLDPDFNYDQQQIKLYAGSDASLDTVLNVSSVAWLHIEVDPDYITNTGGYDHIDGTYTNVALTGGSGLGIKATVVVAGNEVTSVTITDVGDGYYKDEDVLTIPIATIGGSLAPTCLIEIMGAPRTGFTITAPNITNPSSDHNNGTYYGVYLTGGFGFGISATVIVSGGLVTSVTITDNGVGYKNNDALTIPTATTGGSTASTCTIRVEGLVNQLTRNIGYTTEEGAYTFTNAGLSEGSHQIKIYTSTIDGLFSSGTFFGFEFELT
jgi:hypothetical protein